MRLKTLLFFKRTRKSTLLLQPGIVASANRTRLLIFLQTSIKNVQELAKEEGEESDAKLRVAIVTSERAMQTARHMKGDFLEVPTLYGGPGSL